MILEVGKVIYSLLTTNDEVNKLINKKVYPLIADNDTTFPFIVYKRTGVDPTTSKDRLINKSSATIEIVIASNSYNESIKIATAVKNAFLNKKGLISGINVRSINLIGADEDYIEDTFIQKIFLKIEI